MEDHPMFKLFSEISFHNTRLAVLGNDAKNQMAWHLKYPGKLQELWRLKL